MSISRRHSNSNFSYHIVIHWSLFKMLIQSLYIKSHQRETIYDDKLMFFAKLARQWKSKEWAKFELQFLLLIFIYYNSKFTISLVKTRTLKAGTSELIPKRNRLKYLTLHSPFSFLSTNMFKLNGHPECCGIYYSYFSWNYLMHFKMFHFKIKRKKKKKETRKIYSCLISSA